MSATTTPGVSRSNVMGGIVTQNPVAVAVGGVVPKGLWLATGAGLVASGETSPLNFTPPGSTTPVACAFVISDGITISAGAALTLYRFIFG